MAADKKRGAAPGKPGDPEAPSFEDAIERLEGIVDELEGGALTLEESIARYEEGMKLSKHLARALDQAEKRIERLTEDAEGVKTEPLESGPLESDERSSEDTPAEGKLPF